MKMKWSLMVQTTFRGILEHLPETTVAQTSAQALFAEGCQRPLHVIAWSGSAHSNIPFEIG